MKETGKEAAQTKQQHSPKKKKKKQTTTKTKHNTSVLLCAILRGLTGHWDSTAGKQGRQEKTNQQENIPELL